MRRCLIRVRIKNGRWETQVSQGSLGLRSRGGTGGAEGAFPHLSWDGRERGEEAVHIPGGVTYVCLLLCFIKPILGNGYGPGVSSRACHFFCCCYAVTQLARQVQQERTQVVCSIKEAWKRLTESNGTPAMDLGHVIVVFFFFFCLGF